MTSLIQCDKCGITGDRYDQVIKFHEIRMSDSFLNEPPNGMSFLIQMSLINSRTYFADLCDKCFQEMDKTFYLSHKKEKRVD